MTNSTQIALSRRQLVVGASMVAAASIAAPSILRAQTKVAESMPPLPYPDDALAPVLSSNQIGFHYGKHHKAYFDNMVKLVQGTDFANQTVEEIVRTTMVNPNRIAIYNNAAQVWNHTFYCKSMRPNGGGEPPAALVQRIQADFGGFEQFKKVFIDTTVGQFGSGWGWLVENKEKKLQVMRTPNADTPMAQGMKCLIACDVWEHAYYLDYQNRRADYVTAWLDKLVNWEFAVQNLGA
jgi:Fe-Mn family superoxide dismutase